MMTVSFFALFVWGWLAIGFGIVLGMLLCLGAREESNVDFGTSDGDDPKAARQEMGMPDVRMRHRQP